MSASIKIHMGDKTDQRIYIAAVDLEVEDKELKEKMISQRCVWLSTNSVLEQSQGSEEGSEKHASRACCHFK
jgi:hypothetical protein